MVFGIYNFYFTKSLEEGKTAGLVSILPVSETLLENLFHYL